MSQHIETCLVCGQPTGRAGKLEDSIYYGPVGPLCEDCHHEAWSEITNDRIAELEAEVERLRDFLGNCEIGVALRRAAAYHYAHEMRQECFRLALKYERLYQELFRRGKALEGKS